MHRPEAFLLDTRRAPPDGAVGILADAVDPATHEFVSLLAGFDPTDADVFDALSTVRDSGAAVLGKGQRFRDAEVALPGMDRFFAEEVRFALGDLIRDGAVRLDRVEVVSAGTVVEVSVVYTNLSRREAREHTFEVSP